MTIAQASWPNVFRLAGNIVGWVVFSLAIAWTLINWGLNWDGFSEWRGPTSEEPFRLLGPGALWAAIYTLFLAGLVFIAIRSRDRISRLFGVFSILFFLFATAICLNNFSKGGQVGPPGEFFRRTSLSPLWYRCGGVVLSALPAMAILFVWSWQAVRNQVSPRTDNDRIASIT